MWRWWWVFIWIIMSLQILPSVIRLPGIIFTRLLQHLTDSSLVVAFTYYSLNIYATLVDVLGMQVSLLHTSDYSHKPSIEKKASNDVHHIKIHHKSWRGHWYSHHMHSAVNNYYKQELYHNLEFIYLRTHDYAIKNNHCDILGSIHIYFII